MQLILDSKYNFKKKENEKYQICCAKISYLYMKSDNQIIRVKDIIKEMGLKNEAESKKIINRILSVLNKKIIFGNVFLTFSDYLFLQEINHKLDGKTNEITSFLFSLGAIIITFISIIISIDNSNIWGIISSIFIFLFFLFIMFVVDQVQGK